MFPRESRDETLWGFFFIFFNLVWLRDDIITHTHSRLYLNICWHAHPPPPPFFFFLIWARFSFAKTHPGAPSRVNKSDDTPRPHTWKRSDEGRERGFWKCKCGDGQMDAHENKRGRERDREGERERQRGREKERKRGSGGDVVSARCVKSGPGKKREREREREGSAGPFCSRIKSPSRCIPSGLVREGIQLPSVLFLFLFFF